MKLHKNQTIMVWFLFYILIRSLSRPPDYDICRYPVSFFWFKLYMIYNLFSCLVFVKWNIMSFFIKWMPTFGAKCIWHITSGHPLFGIGFYFIRVKIHVITVWTNIMPFCFIETLNNINNTITLFTIVT